MEKVAVIGVGTLGSSIAYEIANRGLVSELVLIDARREIAEGNADDIRQSLVFRNDTRVFAGGYQDIEGSRVIIVAAGKPRSTGMNSRMDLLEINRRIVKEISSHLVDLAEDTIIVTLSNPIDIMNFLMWKYTGLGRERIIGSAGMLDSSRFRSVLSKKYRIPPSKIYAYVIGEHGSNQVPVFSKVRIDGKKVVFSKDDCLGLREQLEKAASEVISKKGATIFAPANNTTNLIESILMDKDEALICSSILEGEYGLRNVSIGVPAIIGRKGVKRIIEWDLDKEERSIFLKGANNLKSYLGFLSNESNRGQ